MPLIKKFSAQHKSGIEPTARGGVIFLNMYDSVSAINELQSYVLMICPYSLAQHVFN